MKKEHWLYIIIAILAIWIIASYASAPKTEAPTQNDLDGASMELQGSLGSDTGDNTTTDTPVTGSGASGISVTTNSNSAIESPLNNIAGPNKGVLTEIAPTVSSVMVANQSAGGMVKIDKVSLTSDGWVVIHEDRDGKPGNALGAQRFDKGTYTGGQVELARSTVAGGKYYAMLHMDDGDKMFDLKTDTPTMEDGAVIMTSFTAQ
ncbi:MAG TPA: hypothetical protein VJJ22_02120 [Candidatus Paceibacterota bacterium]